MLKLRYLHKFLKLTQPFPLFTSLVTSTCFLAVSSYSLLTCFAAAISRNSTHFLQFCLNRTPFRVPPLSPPSRGSLSLPGSFAALCLRIAALRSSWCTVQFACQWMVRRRALQLQMCITTSLYLMMCTSALAHWPCTPVCVAHCLCSHTESTLRDKMKFHRLLYMGDLPSLSSRR